MPLYLLYAGLTVVVGLVLFENELFKPNWTSAVLLGLAAPVLFKSNIKVFRSLSGKEEAGANLDRLVAGVQQFCFDERTTNSAMQNAPQNKRLARV